MKLYHPSEESRSKDFSGIGILLSNALTIIIAMTGGWHLGPLLFIYWAQSIIIGIFHFFRILLLKQFCTEGFTSNGNPVPATRAGKWSTALFFAMHFGFFHLVYLFFLFGIGGGGDADKEEAKWDFLWMMVSAAGFLLGHGYSFYQNVRADLKNRPNLGTMMFLPYARIIPMHLTIIFGSLIGGGRLAALLFSVLKTGADYLMHVVEHRVLQKKTPEAEAEN